MKQKQPKTDWSQIRAHYESSGDSLRQVADQFGVQLAAIKKRSSREKWEKASDASTTEDAADVVDLPDSSPADSSNPHPGDSFTIPEDINSMDRLSAAQYYVNVLGWAVHPLYANDRGEPRERGKKPLFKGWRQHTRLDVTPDLLAKYFNPHTKHNLGCVVRPPFVHVDLDSKADNGASVMEWLAKVPQLAGVPRERTAGGVHLAFRCTDLPERVLNLRESLKIKITDKVDGELYFNGLNIVVSPSIHKSGHRYSWEVTGQIPLVGWADLCEWFGFAEPQDKSAESAPKKEKGWALKWREDLRSLDLTRVLAEMGMLGDCIDGDTSKWTIRCPWENCHSGQINDKPGSDTIIFNTPGTMPGFSCLHAHCDRRSIKDLLEWIEQQRPGLIAANCSTMRVWNPGQKASDNRCRIVLPGLGRPDSEFCREVGADIGPREVWFSKDGRICEVALKHVTEKVKGWIFYTIEPIEAVTSIENFIEVGVLQTDDYGEAEFIPKSMSREDAATLLSSPQFKKFMPEVVRILDIQIPIATGGGIVFPKKGYDPHFRTYCLPDGPEPVMMGIARARQVVREIYSEFCWKDEQSLTHAIARLITPYCRGIMGWDARFPLWFFCANRPRAGKDYVAGVTHVVYEGRFCEDTPIGKDSEETRKRITTALMSGRRTIHFANCQEYLQDQYLIGAVTSKTFAARNLGSTEAKADLVMANEIEFSVSANVGLAFREDIEPRTRRIELEFLEENANGRNFTYPDLHGWIYANRPLVLGAVASLVRHWLQCGAPAGSTPFNSFPEWARVVGGVMECCELGNPCLPHERQAKIGGDSQERAMRAIYRIGYARHPEEWIPKARLFEMLAEVPEDATEELGAFMVGGDLTTKEARMRIGRALHKYHGRHLDGIQMLTDENSNTKRQRVIFKKPAPTKPIDLDHFFGGKFSTPSGSPDDKNGTNEMSPPLENGTGEMSPPPSNVTTCMSPVTKNGTNFVTATAENGPNVTARMSPVPENVTDFVTTPLENAPNVTTCMSPVPENVTDFVTTYAPGDIEVVTKMAPNASNSPKTPDFAQNSAKNVSTFSTLYPSTYPSKDTENLPPEKRIYHRTGGKNVPYIDGIYEWGQRGQSGHPALPVPDWAVCSLRSDLERVAADLENAPSIALDIETFGPGKDGGLNPWKGDIRLLALCREGGPVWLLDLRSLGYDLGPLAPILQTRPVLAHNAKFDLLWLRRKCAIRTAHVFCTLTAARILAAGTKPGNNLDQCLERYLGIKPAQDHSRSDWGSMLLTDDQLAYAARDVAHLHALLHELEERISAGKLSEIWRLERALLPVVVDMEHAGIAIDRQLLEELDREAKSDAEKAAAALREAFKLPALNPASPAQLLDALRNEGIQIESTSEEALSKSRDSRLVPLILAYREAVKRAQQTTTLLQHIAFDGRIHARFEPTGTDTGRFSSKGPNLQNIGRGRLRECFVPAPGHLLIVADYSQIELRAAAAIAGESKMIEAYRRGEDLHKLTAATVLGKPLEEVTKDDRQISKSCNFGLIYGQSANGLVRYAASSYGVQLSTDRAEAIRRAFFRTYAALRQWHGLSHNLAEEGIGEVRTRMGRRRLIPEAADDWERFTALVNTPVQGACADGLKLAIVLLAERLPDSARILSTVHDELIVEAPEAEAQAVCELVRHAMIEAMAGIFPEVPIEVESGVCRNWSEK